MNHSFNIWTNNSLTHYEGEASIVMSCWNLKVDIVKKKNFKHTKSKEKTCNLSIYINIWMKNDNWVVLSLIIILHPKKLNKSTISV